FAYFVSGWIAMARRGHQGARSSLCQSSTATARSRPSTPAVVRGVPSAAVAASITSGRAQRVETGRVRLFEIGTAEQRRTALWVCLVRGKRSPRGGTEALAVGLNRKLIPHRAAGEERTIDVFELRDLGSDRGLDRSGVGIQRLDAARNLLLACGAGEQ